MSPLHGVTRMFAGTIVSALLAAAACGRLGFHRLSSDESSRAKHSGPVALGPPQLALGAAPADAQRLLLDARALERLKQSAKLQTPAFQYASARAEEAIAKPLPSGYQGFEWADAVAGNALLWHATGDARYAAAAIRYLNGLLDDRLELGDGKGGADVVKHDSGYGIRTFGAYSALAYDWLRGAPGMDEALRARVLARLTQWLAWYAKDGYLRDHAISNYYWGYLTTLTFAGLAAAGQSPAADQWLHSARDELSARVLPSFADDLPGGGWPEGWQYGEYTSLEIGLVAEAWRTGAGINVASKWPWLAETVTHHVHALLPDEQTVYDGGTWGEHPAHASGVALAALSIALEGVNDERASEARWMLAHALPAMKREQAWLGLLADRPGAPERSPRAGATSLHLPGVGLTFARSDWSHAAVWASFQAGPPLAEDHQDADQGHFELFRGSDGLIVDGGGSEGSATINHNCLLVDDDGRTLNYPPNQGVWGRKVKTTRFGDDGLVAAAVGDIGEAYAPSCAADGCRKRSVDSAVRSFVYVRPSLLVIEDRITLDSPDYGVTWAAHVTQPPTVAGNLVSALVGASRVDIHTLEPADAESTALHEPTPSGEGSHRLNQPWGPMWRIEVNSARGERERRFLHFITAGARNDPAPASRRVSGGGLHGGLGSVDGHTIAVLFADASGAGRVSLDKSVELLVVAALTPGARYQVSLDGGTCNLDLRPSNSAADRAATSGGFLRINVAQCGVK